MQSEQETEADYVKKHFCRKALCILLACVLVCTAVFPAFAGTPAEDAHLHFNKDGRFRILNISDIQDDESLDSRVTAFIRQAVYAACPDLIVLTGDNIYGPDAKGTANTRTAIAQFMSVFQQLGVPVAIVFGNHDDDGNSVSKEAQMEMYSSYSVSISYDEGDSMAGCGTYNVPIYGSTETDKVKFNLWMFDTGSSINNAISGKYDYMRADQLAWYVNKSNELKAGNGGICVPSIAFQHIIVNDIYDALKPVSSGGVTYNGQNYALPDTAAPGSILGEHPCPSGNENEKEFATIKQQGDVLAIVCGHDHKNMFVVPYQGVDLITTPAAGFYETKVLGLVVYQGDAASRGARIIDVYEQTGTYETRMLNLRDMAREEIYTPTNTVLSSQPLRETYFNTDKFLKAHADTVYSEETIVPLNQAMAYAGQILSDLDADRQTSRFDQTAIDQARNNILTCMQNLELASYTILFDANGGTCAEAFRKVPYGNVCGTLPDAQRERYLFAGWFTEREGGVQITANTVFPGTDARTVYAHWTEDPDWHLPGDLDEDRVVDLRDVVLMQRYLVGGWNVQLNPEFADVNADGRVDLRDVMLLRRYLAGGWGVVLV